MKIKIENNIVSDMKIKTENNIVSEIGFTYRGKRVVINAQGRTETPLRDGVKVENRLPLCELVPAEKHQCECTRCLYGIE